MEPQPRELQHKRDPERARVDLNAADYDERCSLHVAAAEGHRHIVEEYLKHDSVRPQVKDRWGATPLDEAKKHGHEHIVKILEKIAG